MTKNNFNNVNFLKYIFFICFTVLFVLNPLSTSAKPVKNVIFMIGDGMGPQQLAFAVIYAKYANNSKVRDRKLNIEKIMDVGETGLAMVGPYESIVVDSACSATQFATGQPARSETIGLDFNGNPIETILEKARKAGKATGIISDTRISHATPAAFVAHVAHRSMESQIAEQIVDSKVDIMLSGGLQFFLPKDVNKKGSNAYEVALSIIGDKSLIKSKRKDQENLLIKAKKNGYELVFNKNALIKSKSRNILGLFSASFMPDGIVHSQTKELSDRTIPTLKEMTDKAISVLSTNKKGFFLMIEGGRIDHAGHANDAGWLLHEILKFDEAIGSVFNWVKDRDDTLVIITADHETGSFGFSYSAYNIPKPSLLTGESFKNRKFGPQFNFGSYEVLDKIYNQKKTLTMISRLFDKLPSNKRTAEQLEQLVNKNLEFKITLEQAKEILEEEVNQYYVEGHPYLGFKMTPPIHDFKAFYGYINNNRQALIARKIAKQQQIVWGTGAHTTTPVVVVAFGPKPFQNKFDGLLHSTEIGKKCIESMGY